MVKHYHLSPDDLRDLTVAQMAILLKGPKEKVKRSLSFAQALEEAGLK